MKLEVRGGCFAYPKSDRQILKEISFCAASGQTVAILGPNGAAPAASSSAAKLSASQIEEISKSLLQQLRG